MGLFTKGASEYRKGLKAEEAKDFTTAFRLYEESAEKGYAWGCYKLAVCYSEGLGVEQNYRTALSWAKDADKFDTDGDIEDAFGLVCRLEKKIRELERAEKVAAKKAADEERRLEEQKNEEELIRKSEEEFPYEKYPADEFSNMAFEFYKAREYEKALGIFLRYAVAGVAQAQYICGMMYQGGEGAAASKERALFWMEKAAEQDIPDAQYECAMLQTDLKPHIHWLTKAYKQTENAEVREKAEARLKRLGIPLDSI
ncbi:MAG: sel1 repeat family protein [Oscillospiraceae bacterium]|nr:sel1 repeat family protein [Oscillospiraceae bacterium]